MPSLLERMFGKKQTRLRAFEVAITQHEPVNDPEGCRTIRFGPRADAKLTFSCNSWERFVCFLDAPLPLKIDLKTVPCIGDKFMIGKNVFKLVESCDNSEIPF
jgi:hypothetical protein